MSDHCIFCDIVAGELPASIVYQDELTMAFLDRVPVFPGHTLVIPRQHVDTLLDMPPKLAQPMTATITLIGRAMEEGLEAQGSFVCANVKVSQTVPHVHVHVMPRRKGDGMKGFFWPRRPYPSDEAREKTLKALKEAIKRIRES